MKKKRHLTPKEEIFAQVYASTGNGTLAYKKAGYSLKMTDASMYTKAWFIKNKEEVRQRIDEILAERAKLTIPDLEYCNRKLMTIVRASAKELFTEEVDEETGEVISRLKSPEEMDILTADALKKLKRNKSGDVEYEFYNPVEAIRQLASLNGWEVPKQVNLNNFGGLNELRIGFEKDTQE